MFLKLSENLEKTLPLRRVYKGKVVDNADPEKLGRVKCTISGIFEGDAANLPWIFPHRNGLHGGKADSGSYAVPEVDSYLEIRFPTEDIYSPFYYGYWEDANTHIPDFDTDYPDTYGWVDSTGTKVIINKKQKSFDFTHTSGIAISMDKDGNLTMNIPKDVTETIEGKKSQTITGDKETTAENITQTANTDHTVDAGGNASVTAGGDVTMEGDGSGTFAGKGGTDVGDSGSSTNVKGTSVSIAGGGLPIARLGDQTYGVGNLGGPVIGAIIQGSPKVNSG